MKKMICYLAAVLLLASMTTTACGKSAAAAADTAVTSADSKAEEGKDTEDESVKTESVQKESEPEGSAEDGSEQTEAGREEAGSISGDPAQKKADEKEEKNGYIVCIDPGHSSVMPSFGSEPLGPGSGEYKSADTSGTHGNASGLAEYELTLQIGLALRDELEKRGYEVVLTREDNKTPVSCVERAAVATDAGADIFVRLHANGSGNPSTIGAMGLCITPTNAFHPELYKDSRMLTDDILNTYREVTGIENGGGVWETDTMSGNNWSTVPATILEMGFMTSPEEDQWMADPENQVKMVKGIADGIDLYFTHLEEKKSGENGNDTASGSGEAVEGSSADA